MNRFILRDNNGVRADVCKVNHDNKTISRLCLQLAEIWLKERVPEAVELPDFGKVAGNIPDSLLPLVLQSSVYLTEPCLAISLIISGVMPE